MKLGPRYLKSLKALAKGPLNIDGKNDIVRYKNLEGMGLCKGVGVRVVGLTKAGRAAIATGDYPDPEDTVESSPEPLRIPVTFHTQIEGIGEVFTHSSFIAFEDEIGNVHF